MISTTYPLCNIVVQKYQFYKITKAKNCNIENSTNEYNWRLLFFVCLKQLKGSEISYAVLLERLKVRWKHIEALSYWIRIVSKELKKNSFSSAFRYCIQMIFLKNYFRQMTQTWNKILQCNKEYKSSSVQFKTFLVPSNSSFFSSI